MSRKKTFWKKSKNNNNNMMRRKNINKRVMMMKWKIKMILVMIIEDLDIIICMAPIIKLSQIEIIKRKRVA